MVTALLYLLIYTGGLIKALAGKPIWGLYVYFFSFYFHAPTMWWGASLPNLRWSLISAVITLIAILIYPPKRGFRFFYYRENIFITGLALLVIVQLSWVAVPNLHMEYVILIVKFIILIFLIQNLLLTSSDIRGFIWANLFGCAYLAYYGMSMHTGGRIENFGQGSGWDSNLAAQHFCAMILLGGYLLLEKFNKSHIFVALTIAVILMGLFMTESRSAIIAIVAVGMVAFVFRPQGRTKKFVLLGTLALVAGASLMGPQIIERFQGVKKDSVGEMQDKSAESRFVIINSQIEMWKDYMVFGYGHRGTLILSPQYIPEEYMTKSQGFTVRASHNVATAFLVDHGTVGFLLYFGAIFSCLIRVFGYKIKAPVDEQTDDERFHSSILLAGIFSLLVFIMCGMGSNNKKLEADIWLLALIPVLSQKIKDSNKEREKTNLLESV